METLVLMLMASYQCCLRFFHSICLKCCACHEKVMPGHTKCSTCHAKIILANLKVSCSKMQPISGNQRPDLLTSLMNMSLVLPLPSEMHLLQIIFKCPTPANVIETATKFSRFAHLWQGIRNPLRLPGKTTSRHNGVQFFQYLNF